MNAVAREFLPSHLTHRWRLALGCILLVLLGSLRPVGAQTIVPLVTYTNLWQYDQSGTNHGTAWREPDFDDSAWATGRGLFVAETTPDVYTVTAPINTALLLGPAPGTTNYYFRTHFNFAAADFIAGLVLKASLLVDDGCVIYLNGVEAGRLRVPANQTALTYASSFVTPEGTNEVITIATNLLRIGENVLAVEVHQSNAGSSDVAWGALLTASVPQAPVITNQPQSLTLFVGASATFNVGFTGGPVTFQWQKETAPASGIWDIVGTGDSFSIASVILSKAGNYRVVLSNVLGVAISATALLTVFNDLSGPVMLRAEVQEASNGSTNRIIIYWNERLVPSSAIATSNYRITHLNNTNSPLAFTASYQSSPSLTLLNISPSAYTNWFVNGLSNYLITVNNIRDSSPSNNVVAPNSQIGVSWLRHVPGLPELLPADALWDFHSSAVFEPTVYDEPWFATNYVGSYWWAQGRGLFRSGLAPQVACLGEFQTETDFQPDPTLLRTTFQWPAGIPTSVRLRLAHQLEDGAVFYLNGVQILRSNVLGDGPVTRLTRSVSEITTAACATNVLSITNLLPGTNWLAVAVVNSTGAYPYDADLVFGMRLLSATYYLPAPLPDAPAPVLQITPVGTNAHRLSWTGPGYALESVTNLTTNVISAPFGPWTEVRNMSNPYTNANSGPQRFFRLKK